MGVLGSRSLMVSEISRTLHDDPAGLFHREKRICGGLASEKWDEEPLRRCLLERNGRWAKADQLVVVDLSEVVKPYGKAFQHLDRARDASDPRKDPPAIKPGYWLWEAYVEVCPGDLRPLQVEVISLRKPGVLSLPAEVQEYLKGLREVVHLKAILVLDRGFDSHDLIRFLLAAPWRFILRLRGDRSVYAEDGRAYLVRELGEAMLARANPKGGYRLAMQRVRLGACQEWMWLIAYQGEGWDKPLYLLVHDDEVRSLADAERCVNQYLRRWGGEDAIRFLKQALGLESFRVRSWLAIRRLVLLACWAMTLLAELDDLGLAWVERLVREAFTFGEKVKIRLYHLSRGVARVLTGQAEGCPLPSG
jgi:hypothetical protein